MTRDEQAIKIIDTKLFDAYNAGNAEHPFNMISHAKELWEQLKALDDGETTADSPADYDIRQRSISVLQIDSRMGKGWCAELAKALESE